MKMQNIYTMEYLAAVNKKEIMKFAGRWIELEKKSSWVRKSRTSYHLFFYMWLLCFKL